MIAAPPIVAAASAIVGSPVKVFCRPTRTMDGDQGHVYFRDAIPDHTIYLDVGVCRRLAHPQNGFDALDMLVVAHEAAHIATSSTNECMVEQTALANIWPVVRAFRLSARLARWALANAPIADATRLGRAYHVDPVTGAC